MSAAEAGRRAGARTREVDTASGEKPGRRRRGRPPRLSREIVVDAVLAMLERDPDEPLTLARIAQEVDAVPAALYRHFEGLDELLDAVLARVLESSDSTLDDRKSWQQQLGSWMHGLRAHLLQYPAVLLLIDRTERTSPEWLEMGSALAAVLTRAGLTGRELAATYLWILETTVGLVMQEAAMPLSEQIAKARAAQRKLSAVARERFAPLAPAVAKLSGDELFDFAVEQAVAAVEMRRAPAKKR